MECGHSGRRGAPWGLQKAVLSSHRIGGSCLPNWQVKLSIKEKLAGPGQGGGGKNLALVGNIVGSGAGGAGRGEILSTFHKVLGFPELTTDNSSARLGLRLSSLCLETMVGLIWLLLRNIHFLPSPTTLKRGEKHTLH